MEKGAEVKIQDPVLNEILSRLVPEFSPTRIYLFGSRAKGNERPDSDYDLLLVVKSSDRGRLGRMDQARDVLRGIKAGADVFVYTQAEFDEWKDEFSSIPETAVNTGMELHVG
jgi:predicted nucleotidyltransferase